MKKTFLNWSSGKDAAFALLLLQQGREYSVEKLVTTINTEIGRVSMHGIRTELLQMQADSLGIPLHIINLPGTVPMETYNEIMREEMSGLLAEGFTHSVFGDILLEDLKVFREQQLANIGLQACFPLWKRDTSTLMRDFIGQGFKAITVCTNSVLLDQSFCGRLIDEAFLAELPEGVDPCGENGEFHTFVFDGPNFKRPIDFVIGEFVSKSYEPKENKRANCFSQAQESWDTSFLYCDLIPR